MIEIVDPGYPGEVWWILVIVLAILGAGFGLPAIFYKKAREDLLTGFILFLVPLLAILPAGLPSVSQNKYADEVDARKVEALQEAGYDNVVITGDEFTAKAADGSYFEGYLRPEGDLTWRIISLEEKK